MNRVSNASWTAVLLLAMPVFAQESPIPNSNQNTISDGIVRSIEFVGLRRIPATTLRAKLSSKIDEVVNPSRIQQDVRALDATGWFESVSVELEEMPVLLARAESNSSGDDPEVPALFQHLVPMRLIFRMEEEPFLAKVEFQGGHLLTRDRIREVFAQRGVTLKIAAPCNRTELWRAARLLEEALLELGHPRAIVKVHLTDVAAAAVLATFIIQEGPRIEVEQVQFSGNAAFPDRVLQRQLKEIAPGALLAEWRGKTIYTPKKLENEAERIREFYRNHGFAEAKTGIAQVQFVALRARRWFPWPGTISKYAIRVTIPVQEGIAYHLGRTETEGLIATAPENVKRLLAPLQAPAEYSEAKILSAKQKLARAETTARANKNHLRVEIAANLQLNRESRVVRVQFVAREAAPILVRRIEFTGHKRFSDRYYRRKILLQEGEPFNSEKLERGLAQLARGGFVRPAKAEDIQLSIDDEHRTADLRIRVEEIGRQRVSLVGGVNTIGIAYSLFNLLGGEEWLTAHLEGGPESLHVLLGMAKESVFGTPTTLGVSVFQNVVQPRIFGRGRLVQSSASGLSSTWNYAISARETLGVNYELSKNETRVPLQIPVLLPTGELREVRKQSVRSGMGLNWTSEKQLQRLDAATAVTGGWLGGEEQSVRASLTGTRLMLDPLSGGRNTWAFRGTLSGISSFGGATLPISARIFAGDELIRGFRRGELGPIVARQKVDSNGASVSGTEAGGANAMLAFNAEYRVPLESHTEFAAFFDAGTARLVPHWLGGARPIMLRGTNGLARGSAGVELRLRLPVIDQPLRIHYAINPWRLAQAILLPDGSKFLPTDRRTALGWALGSLF